MPLVPASITDGDVLAPTRAPFSRGMREPLSGRASRPTFARTARPPGQACAHGPGPAPHDAPSFSCLHAPQASAPARPHSSFCSSPFRPRPPAGRRASYASFHFEAPHHPTPNPAACHAALETTAAGCRPRRAQLSRAPSVLCLRSQQKALCLCAPAPAALPCLLACLCACVFRAPPVFRAVLAEWARPRHLLGPKPPSASAAALPFHHSTG